jgi:hypothetical protein
VTRLTSQILRPYIGDVAPWYMDAVMEALQGELRRQGKSFDQLPQDERRRQIREALKVVEARREAHDLEDVTLIASKPANTWRSSGH